MSASASTALTFTGERFAPEVTGAIWYEHWHRYCLVRPLARGLAVLDAACGEGYGSSLLAATAREVVGIDIAGDAVAHARARYAAPNLRYLEGSCTALPLADASIDLVVSFETIEHLPAQAEMLAEFRRVLAPSGVLVISSPNKPVYSGAEPGGNEFHVRELTRDELAQLLDPAFPQQRWYGQRVVAHSALWAERADPAAPRACTLRRRSPATRCASKPSPRRRCTSSSSARRPACRCPRCPRSRCSTTAGSRSTATTRARCGARRSSAGRSSTRARSPRTGSPS